MNFDIVVYEENASTFSKIMSLKYHELDAIATVHYLNFFHPGE